MKSFFAKILLVAVSISLTIVVLEVCLRLLGPPLASCPVVPDAVLDHVPMRDFAFKSYRPDGNFAPFVFYWDVQGHVADPEKKIVFDPARHSRNIALVGDSYVEASQVPYISSFSGILNAHAASNTFFINWGVASYSPMIYLPLWRTRILETRPAHVFILLYENDVDDDHNYAMKAQFGADGLPLRVTAKPEPLFLTWVRRSSLFRTLRFACVKISAGFRAKHDPTVANAGNFQEVTPEIEPLTSRVLIGIQNEVAASGAKLTILAVPSRRADILGDPSGGPSTFASHVNAWCRANGVDYLDLEQPFLSSRRQHGKGQLFFSKDIHFTAAAHQIVAEVIQKKHPEYFLGREAKVRGVE